MRIFDLPNQSVRWLIAELVVVVLGILIAFQVEEWRTVRSDRTFSESSLRAILVELEDEYADFQLVIPSLQSNLQSGKDLTEILSTSGGRNEFDLIEAFSGVAGVYGWFPNSPTYSGLRESGRIYLILDRDLIDSMFDYYEFGEFVGVLMDRVETSLEEFRKSSLTDLYSSPSDNSLADRSGLGRIALDRKLALPLGSIPRNPEFYGSLGNLMSRLNSALGRFAIVSERNLALQELIKIHIANQ